VSESILIERQGRRATVSINRPPLNILDLSTIAELGGWFTELGEDAELQLLVLRGSGGKAFSAGVAVEDHTPERVPGMLREFHSTIRSLQDMPAVTLAVVEGHCLGGGMELAAGCDLILATDDSRFGQPEIKLGCYPPLAAALYPSLLGSQHTADLLLTGRTLSCREATEMGFVGRRVCREELTSTLEDLVDGITGQSLAVTRLTKRAIRLARNLPYSEALARSEELYLEELIQTEDMHEGLAAFMEKRQPEWKHR